MERVKFAQNLDPNTDRVQSDAIWKDCPLDAIRNGSINGWYDEDDFNQFPLPGTQTSAVAVGTYVCYDTGAGVVGVDIAGPTAFNPGGIISILADTNNDSGVIGSVQTPFSLLTTGAVGKLWFECRVATTGILVNANHLFIGLAENASFTFGANQPLGDANATANNGAMIGFNRLESGLGVLNFSYADRAVAWTDVKASVGSIAALTFVKLGFVFDPQNPTKCVTPFVNGVESGTALSKATLLAATFLDVGALGFCMAQRADSAGTANFWYCDWYRCFQKAT
jgi:hypothetical protein